MFIVLYFSTTAFLYLFHKKFIFIRLRFLISCSSVNTTYLSSLETCGVSKETSSDYCIFDPGSILKNWGSLEIVHTVVDFYARTCVSQSEQTMYQRLAGGSTSVVIYDGIHDYQVYPNVLWMDSHLRHGSYIQPSY